jgi:hypothetical protein
MFRRHRRPVEDQRKLEGPADPKQRKLWRVRKQPRQCESNGGDAGEPEAARVAEGEPQDRRVQGLQTRGTGDGESNEAQGSHGSGTSGNRRSENGRTRGDKPRGRGRVGGRREGVSGKPRAVERWPETRETARRHARRVVRFDDGREICRLETVGGRTQKRNSG